MQRRLACSLVAAMAACLTVFGNPSPVSAEVRYTVTDLSAIWREAKGNDRSIDYFSASSINDLGQIAGGYATMDGTYHAFMWDPTTGLHDIGVLGGSTNYSVAYDINNRGQVVGESARGDSPGSGAHAFLWDPTTGLQDLGSLSGDSYAVSINDNSQVVGGSWNSDGHVHGFLWSADRGMIDLGTLGGESSGASAINNAGQIVGYAEAEVGLAHSFLWDAVDGTQDLGTLAQIRATRLNDRGWIVGYVTRSTPVEEFFPPNAITSVVVWDGDTLQELGTLAGMNTHVSALNNHDQVVGDGLVPIEGRRWMHAYLWEESTGFQDLNDLVPTDLPWILNFAADINNGGSIVALQGTSARIDAVLLLTPIPEPSMMILLLTLLGVFGVGLRHRGNGKSD